ncbi:MAG: ATP synthase F0 subunit C [Planctomycetes bacterium]|nr:ATP synthase F0 subunit C [Planctomycetota bacterium]
MNKITTLAVIAAASLASTTLAADGAVGDYKGMGVGIGAGIVGGLAVLGAGLGIGKIGASANESTARQPEMGGRIFTNMILTAALVEGVALFAVVVSLLGINK